VITQASADAVESHSTELRKKIGLLRPGLDRAAHAFWSQPEVTELYPELLFSIHCVNRASVPLMQAAVEAARARPEADQVSALLAGYLDKHIPEELHHDDWTLDDLEVTGRSRDEILRRIPSPTVAAMVGTQYYLILHVHPVAILGYMAVLEGEPPSLEAIEEVIERTGLPREAFRTYLEHARLDAGHRDDLDAALDRMPLTPDQRSLLSVSAFQTISLERLMFEELIDAHRLRSGRPAS
jgi:Iron-containing redox enzyme